MIQVGNRTEYLLQLGTLTGKSLVMLTATAWHADRSPSENMRHLTPMAGKTGDRVHPDNRISA